MGIAIPALTNRTGIAVQELAVGSPDLLAAAAPAQALTLENYAHGHYEHGDSEYGQCKYKYLHPPIILISG